MFNFQALQKRYSLHNNDYQWIKVLSQLAQVCYIILAKLDDNVF